MESTTGYFLIDSIAALCEIWGFHGGISYGNRTQKTSNWICSSLFFRLRR